LTAAACGPSGEGATTPDGKGRRADRTEVSIERAPIDGGMADEPSPGAASAGASRPASDAGAIGAGDAPADATIGGPQEPAVEKALAPVRPRIHACYKKALAAEPGIGGSATFDVTMSNAGHVSAARFVKRDGLNDDMVGCLLAAIKAMTFEPGKKSQILALSFGSPPDGGARPAGGASGADAGTGDAGAKR
jgi:hypothetical protein